MIRSLIDSPKKLIKVAVFIIPFILGTAGLAISGEGFLDSMFYSFNMYFMCYGRSAPNIIVEIARWAAPIIMISAVITTLQMVWNEVRNKKKLKGKNSFALYCSEDKKEEYLAAFPNAVYCGDAPCTDAKLHLLMLDTDRENIELANTIKTGKTYIELKETDSFLMKSTEKRFFNINELVARDFWKKHDLLNEDIYSLKIGIVGAGNLARALLKYGILNNIYDMSQCIEYRIYGEMPVGFTVPEMGNADTVVLHPYIDESIFECNRVIFTENVDTNILEELLYRSQNSKIYYYGAAHYLENVYDGSNIFCYGDDVLNEKSIFTTELYRDAMLMNYHYKCMYEGCDPDAPDKDALAEKYYEELSGFFKGSNIAACDYNIIRKKILEHDGNPEIVQDDRYVRMEHLRWSRYYWVNHWKFGIPKDKKERNALRIHPCLVSYDKLSDEDKSKDLETIRIAMSIQ